ncbi:unnamed protein product [Bursaphelenchus xylophilus]|uniref:(pine wood nematode) hypothetical protein n=1 Tax=Bursaphelenchus xylophilus TaxID=6326 RepID=A0A1I7S3S7_BURXY|nr:unnamed protein product [Bursaphelenchus xylophilus]CAG9116498.1 unnamed protein product [Bursaphelenchus xylophilus]
MAEREQKEQSAADSGVNCALRNLNSKLWEFKFGSGTEISDELKEKALRFADKCGLLLIEALKESDVPLLRSEKSSDHQKCTFLQDVAEFKSSLMLVAGPYPTKESYQMTVASVGLISIPSFVETLQQHPGDWKKLQQLIVLPDPGWLIHWDLTELSNQMVFLIKTLIQLSPQAQIFICEIPELGSLDYLEKVKKFNVFLQSGKDLPKVSSVDIKGYLPEDFANNNGSSYLAINHAEYLIKQLVDVFSGTGIV